jgi:pimeloyl-ACP methyl ester carboxylesterase
MSARTRPVIISFMSVSGVLIVILLLVAVFVAVSVALGRSTYEVGSARDTEYLELEGNWIRYRVAGGGPPVVLVHGWLSSGRVWNRLAARLAQRYTVYTLDLSGFGDSDKPISGYGVRYGSRLLYAFCAHFGLTRASVVGHDLGGAMAVKLAADHPDVVGRLVLVATPADEEQMDLPTLLWLATLPVVGPLFYTLGKYLRFLRKLWVRPFVSDPASLTEEVVDDAGRSTPAAATKTLQVMQREISRGRLARQARIIKVPVLAIAGEEDQIVDPQATSDWASAFPTSEVVMLEDAGHMPMLEKTGEFNARILAFLTGDPHYLDTADEEMVEDESPFDDDLPEEPFFEEPNGSDDHEAPPTVTRKRDGLYPPRGHAAGHAAGEDDTAGSEEDFAPEGEPRATPGEEERPARARRDRARDEKPGEAPADRMPEDLFRWPDAWKEFRPREPFELEGEKREGREKRSEDEPRS